MTTPFRPGLFLLRFLVGCKAGFPADVGKLRIQLEKQTIGFLALTGRFGSLTINSNFHTNRVPNRGREVCELSRETKMAFDMDQCIIEYLFTGGFPIR
jgi:hypothetical protein